MSRLAIYGRGGFGREVITAARGSRRKLVLIDDEHCTDFAGVPVVGFEDLLPDDDLVIAIADGAIRRRLAQRWTRFGQVIAPTAVIGPEVVIGEGAIICDFALITASVTVGRHFHLNNHCGIAHDCVIGDYVTFAGWVKCNGNVHIHDGAYLGSGAVIKNGTPTHPLTIGEGAIVGMGAVVTRDVAPFMTVVGNPAKPMRASNE